jgi:membrane-bound serine protease (ClpP class)
MTWLSGVSSTSCTGPSSHHSAAVPPSPLRRLWLACLVLWGAAALAQEVERERPEGTRRGLIIRLDGTITPLLEHFIYRALERAEQQGVDVVILEIDSPGGFLDASLSLSNRLRDLTWAETVAYVPREALSGAAIVALGCDNIFLHPSARMGDAGPIFLGEDALFRHAPEKLRSDLAQQIREIARQGGRPPTLAEAMVDMDLLVYEMRHRETEEVVYLSELEIAALDSPEDWERRRPVVESGEGRFLEVTGRRAVELGLADGVVEQAERLWAELNIGGTPSVIRPGTIDSLIYWLNHPLVTGLLFVVGLVALYMELSAPGISLGGLVAGLCFTLFFWSRFLGGTAGWLEVILFLAGLVFLAFELLVFPGFGICGLAGLGLLCVSLVLASQEFVVPETPRQLERFAISTMVLVGSFFLFLAIAVVMTRHFGRLPILNRLTLGSPADEQARYGVAGDKDYSPLPPLLQVALGDIGVADSPLRPAGRALFADEYLDVVADGTFVDAGSPIRIVKLQGNRVVVRAVDESPT